jgi:hypothetical protein
MPSINCIRIFTCSGVRPVARAPVAATRSSFDAGEGGGTAAGKIPAAVRSLPGGGCFSKENPRRGSTGVTRDGRAGVEASKRRRNGVATARFGSGRDGIGIGAPLAVAYYS